MAFSILGVFAHPDDEVTVGPLLARYARHGHRVRVVAVTAGQKGVRPHNGFAPGAALAAVRIQELRQACACLGAEPPVVLRFVDGEIGGRAVVDEMLNALREPVSQSDVVITFGPEGGSGHSDHRVVSAAVTELVQSPGCGVKKLYYVAYPAVADARPAGERLQRAMLSRPVDEAFLTTVVDCRQDLDAADRAIRCHRTQWEPELMRQWTALNRQVLGGRVWLRLALSRVAAPSREDDILAGLC
jgi:LmbE family N-acetylglucosaminyl deacetylase